MYNFLSHLSALSLFLLLAFIFICISLISIHLIKYLVPLDLRVRNNSVIGYTSSLISVIYGVLAGLTALYLINNIGYTLDAVQGEANAVANLYRDSNLLKDPERMQVQIEIKDYLKKVINLDWPLMEKGEAVDAQGDILIDLIATQVYFYSKANITDTILMQDMQQEIKTLYNARHKRIQMSYSQLNPMLWVVILIGSVLTLFINFLFGVNFYLHNITVIAAAFMISSMIFLLITLDKPFQGEFIIEPHSFKTLLQNMEKTR